MGITKFQIPPAVQTSWNSRQCALQAVQAGCLGTCLYSGGPSNLPGHHVPSSLEDPLGAGAALRIEVLQRRGERSGVFHPLLSLASPFASWECQPWENTSHWIEFAYVLISLQAKTIFLYDCGSLNVSHQTVFSHWLKRHGLTTCLVISLMLCTCVPDQYWNI